MLGHLPLSIKLLDVKDDGRCPSDVECYHAGWATVLVEISSKNATERKELRIRGGDAGTYRVPEELSENEGSGNVLSIDEYKVFLAALIPYPVSTTETDKNEYETIIFADTVKSLDFKKEIVKVATEELAKHVSDHSKYKASGIKTENIETFSEYSVTFNIPYERTDQTVQVAVKFTDNQWKAASFQKAWE